MTRPSERDEVQDEFLDELDDYPDDGLPPPPAPVVTDEGIYGTLPEQRRVLREYERRERPWRDTWVRLASVVLAVSGGLWLALLSASQATNEEIAQPALESLIETMTGVEGLLALHEDAIRASSGDAEVPGFPIPDVTIPAGEVAQGPERWREIVLAQSSALVYTQGPDVFASEAEAEGGGTFSTSGGVRMLMNLLSESRHSQASALLLPLGLVALAAAIAIPALGSGFARFQTLGLTLAVVAIPSLAMGVLSWILVAFIGSDGSELAEVAHSIASELVGMPLRNGVTVLIAGFAIAIAARIVRAFFGTPRRAAVYD